MSNAITTFKAGKEYTYRFIGDSDLIGQIKVIKRTKKFATIIERGRESRVGIYIHDGVESLRPDGKYSMCPIVRATKEV